MSNKKDLFQLIGDLELYVAALERNEDAYDVALATVSDIRTHLELEKTMNTMPNTTMIIMNYLDSIEEQIREKRM